VKRENTLETAAVLISALLVAAMASYLTIAGVGADAPPDPHARIVGEARQGAMGWIVRAEIGNRGDTAAVAIQLEATADVDGEEEVSAFDVDYLPGGSTVEVEFAFTGPPDGEVELRLLGYRLP
jgi:uncharacterized protein (TIGR02588 family)